METETLAQLAELAVQLDNAKAMENVGCNTRISIEEKIAALIPGPEKGQKTVKLPDGSKLTVTRGLIYKVDYEEIRKLFPSQGYPTPPIKFQTTYALDEVSYERYRKEYPTRFSAMAKHVEVKPKKTSVTFKKKI